MVPAQHALGDVVRGLAFDDPQAPLLSNADGDVVRSGSELRDRLVAQVAAPVRWDACMATMNTSGVTAMIELAPGGTLVGLAKRALKGIETVALKGPDDLEAARLLLKQAAEAGASA
jgi:[acyl-carrier-protein] S-malonyltransferase